MVAAVKMDRQVVGGYAFQPAGHWIAPAFREHLDRLSDEAAMEAESFSTAELAQAGTALLDLLRGQFLGKATGGRAGTGREWEDMQIGQGEMLDELIGVFESGIGFARKSDENIRADGGIR